MDLKLEAEIEVDGLEGFDRPIRIQASGPYRSNKGKLPSFDIDIDLSVGGPASTVSTGRLSTGDRAFVKFAGSFFESDSKEIARANRELGSQGGSRCTGRGIGIDPRPWIENAKDGGEEQVAGVTTTHVSGSLDVDRMLRDLNKFVGRCGSLLGTAAGAAPDPLKQGDLDKIAQVVNDPSFDVYVGKDDGIVRRLSASVSVKVPQEDRQSVGGVEGGSLRFSIEFANVNGDQAIEAPAKSRPLAELTSQLGADALSGGLGLGSQDSGDNGTSYAECLDRLDPDDTAGLERCNALLNVP